MGKIFVQIGKMGRRKTQSDAQIINQTRRGVKMGKRKMCKNGQKRFKTCENM